MKCDKCNYVANTDSALERHVSEPHPATSKVYLELHGSNI